MDSIVIKGAREHNLKDLDLVLPRNRLVVVSGLSGSGKSSLVFDTIYQESRRRFLETLPTYVLQFMERIPRPDVREITGLSPAVAVEQRNPVNTSRSTVGTITEIYDFLRLAYSRAGETVCPECGQPVRPDTPQSIADELLEKHPGAGAVIAFEPLVSEKLSPGALRASLLEMGFIRLVDSRSGEIIRISGEGEPSLKGLGEGLLVVVDRLRIEPATRGRLDEDLATGLHHGEGTVTVLIEESSGRTVQKFSQRYHCAGCDRFFPEPTPSFFSFNNPYGACPRCRGFGNLLDYDSALVVPDENCTIAGGALDPWTKPRYEGRRAALRSFCIEQGMDIHAPWRELPEQQRKVLLHGGHGFEGVFPFLRKLERKKYKQYIRFFLRSYQSESLCPDCGGGRLRSEAGYVLLGGRSVSELAEMSIRALREFFGALGEIPELGQISGEISSRLDFMLEVGLDYLTLSRLTRTLSGGEYQRIMLTRLLGSGLTETLFVLDEPTIGLHQRDTARLVRVLRRLVDSGNSLVVVEHDRNVLAAAEHVVELGPGSGEHGGRALYSGPPEGLAESGSDNARELMQGGSREKPPGRKARRWLTLDGATLHNLRGMEVRIGLGVFNCVSGVSGSGKSSLVTGVLEPALRAVTAGSAPSAPGLEGVTVENSRHLEGVVLVDQTPIGRTPRSNPVTYVKAFDRIRALFAGARDAKKMGLSASSFSFNTAGGRCENCKGAGHETIEMQFMADVVVPCEQCGGKRYGPSTLRAHYRGKNIDDVLQMTVNEALAFFSDQAGVGKPLWVLQSVGLGYLRLGQSATTLSGGESQRLKIARQLIEGGSGRTRRGRLYILDEPTTGLHAVEVKKLLRVLDRLVEAGNTVLVVEHHPAVISHADWIIDLGPEGGDSGGEVVVQGTPDEVAACEPSYTGRMLSELRRPKKAGIPGG